MKLKLLLFNWKFKNNSRRDFEECNSDVSLDAERPSSSEKTLKGGFV